LFSFNGNAYTDLPSALLHRGTQDSLKAHGGYQQRTCGEHSEQHCLEPPWTVEFPLPLLHRRHID